MVATLICLVTSQVISYIKARAEASGLSGDGGLIERPGAADHRAGRGRAVRSAVPARALAAARRDVGARGGQPGHRRPAAAHRADVAGRDGAAGRTCRGEKPDAANAGGEKPEDGEP